MANGLFEQLRGLDEDGKTVTRVSSHDLSAAVREVQRNKVTGAVAKTELKLTDQSVTELTLLIAEVEAGRLTGQEVTDVLDLIASRRIWTDKAATRARLGI